MKAARLSQQRGSGPNPGGELPVLEVLRRCRHAKEFLEKDIISDGAGLRDDVARFRDRDTYMYDLVFNGSFERKIINGR